MLAQIFAQGTHAELPPEYLGFSPQIAAASTGYMLFCFLMQWLTMGVIS